MGNFADRLKRKKNFASEAEEAYFRLMRPQQLTFDYSPDLDLVIVSEENGIRSRAISLEEAADAIAVLEEYISQFNQLAIDQINSLDDSKQNNLSAPTSNVFLAGWVYLIQQCNSPFYKIGQTAGDVEKRLMSLTHQNPQGLKLVHKFYCQDRRKVEKELHQMYAVLRVRGEWFELSSEDIAEIKAMGDRA